MAYKLFSDKLTPAAATYHGEAEVCSAKFATGPEQIAFVDSWLKNSLVGDAVAEVRKQGGTVLRVTVYRNMEPTWETLWRVDITAYWGTAGYADMVEDVGLEVGFGPWAIVIAAVLVALVAYFLVKPFIDSVTKMLWAVEGVVKPLANPWLWAVMLAGIVVVMSQMGKNKNTS